MSILMYAVGNRPGSIKHDVLYHIVINEMDGIVRIFCETGKNIWERVVEIPLSELGEKAYNLSYEEAKNLYVDGGV